jgi:hypothetical protein
MLAKFELNEANDYHLIIKKIVDELDLNYEPAVGMNRERGEYFEKPVIKIKADGDMIRPKDLLEYLRYKNPTVGDKLLKQIIFDWVNGNIDNYSLTKNIALR